MRKMSFDGIEEAKKPIFYCSFGKDSSVVLHGLRPWLDKTMVVFVDCGGMFPDIVEWADRVGAELPNFMHVHAAGNIWEDIHKKGWSVDVEIADLGRHSDILMREPIAKAHKVRPWTECTMERFWTPAWAFSTMYKPDLFISGEKQLDRPYADDWEWRTHGAQKALRPIFGWSDEDVWEYIDAHDIKMPGTYEGRQADRRDCYLCMGHDLTLDRVKYLKERFPELYDQVFNVHGFREVVPAMTRCLTKVTEAWVDVERLLEEEKNG